MSNARRERMCKRPDQYTAHAVQLEAFVEQHLVDKDGLVYSSIDDRTLRPLADRDIPDRVAYRRASAPAQIRQSGIFGYEDSLMATAEYLMAAIYRHRVTGAAEARERARRSFKALCAVAQAGRRVARDLAEPIPGFLPKPYGGVGTAHLSGETSVDQYMRVMVAIELYSDALASTAERGWINRFLRDCADCWAANNYTFGYFGQTVRWGQYLPHSVAFALYCSALGEAVGQRPAAHAAWFRIFMERTDPLKKRVAATDGNVASLTVLALKGLCRLRPELTGRWRRYGRSIVRRCLKVIDDEGWAWVDGFRGGVTGPRRIRPHWADRSDPVWQPAGWRGNIRTPPALAAAACLDLSEITGEKVWQRRATGLLATLADRPYHLWLYPLTAADLPRGCHILGNLVSGLNNTACLRGIWQWRAGIESG